jgi:hypothetical protein
VTQEFTYAIPPYKVTPENRRIEPALLIKLYGKRAPSIAGHWRFVDLCNETFFFPIRIVESRGKLQALYINPRQMGRYHLAVCVGFDRQVWLDMADSSRANFFKLIKDERRAYYEIKVKPVGKGWN